MRTAETLRDMFDTRTMSRGAVVDDLESSSACKAFLRFRLRNYMMMPDVIGNIYHEYVIGNDIVFPIITTAGRYRREGKVTGVIRDLNKSAADTGFMSRLHKGKYYHLHGGILLDENLDIILMACKEGWLMRHTDENRAHFRMDKAVLVVDRSVIGSDDPVKKYIQREVLPFMATLRLRSIDVDGSAMSAYRVERGITMAPEIRIMDTSVFVQRPVVPDAQTTTWSIAARVKRALECVDGPGYRIST